MTTLLMIGWVVGYGGFIVTVVWALTRLQQTSTRELIDDIKRNNRIVGIEDGEIILSSGKRVGL